MRQLAALGFVALLIVVSLFIGTGQAQNCIEIPPDYPFIYTSRFVAYRIESQGLTGQCWATNRTGYDHQQLCDYIAGLDGTATCVSQAPVIGPVSPISPVSPLYLPIIVRNR